MNQWYHLSLKKYSSLQIQRGEKKEEQKTVGTQSKRKKKTTRRV